MGRHSDGVAPVGAGGRWSHLPGEGRGVVQPSASRRAGVAVRRAIKPVVILGFFAVALVAVIGLFPGLVSGLGGVAPSAPSTPAATHTHGGR